MIGREIYHVNSKSRLNPQTSVNSNFQYPIDLPPNSDYDRISLLKVSIPKSYYNVDSNFGFTLDENGSTVAVTMTAANYTRRAFRTVLQDSLNTVGGWTYSISYDNSINTGDTGKWTFSVSGNGGIQPSFIFTSGSRPLELLGFDEYSGLTKTFSGDSLTSENVPVLQSEQTIFIRSDICQNYNNTILGTAFVDAGDFSSITFACPDVIGYSRQFVRNQSNIYTFQITDENGVVLDLNGVNVNMEIIIFREANIYNLLLSQLRLLAAKELSKSASSKQLEKI